MLKVRDQRSQMGVEMEVYLDNSATTKPFEQVVQKVTDVMRNDYGNPSSMHKKGVESEHHIKDAKSVIAKVLKVNEKEIFFTSGGTEADNWAVLGVARANQRAGKHIITTKIEHPAILQPMELLKEEGFEITYLGVDHAGKISLEELEHAMRPDTILVSIMQANNEVGSIQPVEKAGELIKQKNPNTLFHVDAVQGFGKVKLYPKKSKIDLLSVSGHKIHGPKGVGFLYLSEKVKIKPLMLGGGQQKGFRSGTDNVPGIAGLGAATNEIFAEFDAKQEKLYDLRTFFVNELIKMDDVVINGEITRDAAPHIISASFEGIKSEVLLHALEEKGIYVSSGSACASNKPSLSATLQAMRVNKKLLDATIRFSFSIFTTKEELEYTIQTLKELVPVLRKYARH